MKRTLCALSLLVLTLAGVGCGNGRAQVPTHPVSGQVIYDGQPAVGVKVYLVPTSAPTVPTIPSNPSGVTGPDGKFTLTTYADGDGAPEGRYQVVLLWIPENNQEESSPDRFLGWHDTVHSKLTARVKAGDNALEPFKLPAVTAPPQAVTGIPGRN